MGEKNEAPCDDAASDFECRRTRSITKADPYGRGVGSHKTSVGTAVLIFAFSRPYGRASDKANSTWELVLLLYGFPHIISAILGDSH